ncbi:hypothetical protein L1887_47041 [Cichorium endivia]|nr:hypothetical protein L1887_47041 [Cichorium endivia]
MMGANAAALEQLGNRTIYLGNIHPETTTAEICNHIRGGILQNIRFIPEKQHCLCDVCGSERGAGVLPPGVVLGHHDPQPAAQDRVGQAFGTAECGDSVCGAGGRIAQRYGEIETVNSLREKNCAFANFTNIQSAIKCIEGMKSHPDYQNVKISYGKDRCGNPPRSLGGNVGHGGEAGARKVSGSVSPNASAHQGDETMVTASESVQDLSTIVADAADASTACGTSTHNAVNSSRTSRKIVDRLGPQGVKLAARALSFLYTCARSLSVALYICRSPLAVVVAVACKCVSVCAVPGASHMKSPNLSYEPSAPRPRSWTGAALGYSCQHRKQIPIALWAGIPKKVDLKAERASEADKRVTRNTPPRRLALWLSRSLSHFFASCQSSQFAKKKNPAHSRFSIIAIPFTTTTSSSPLRSSTSSQLGARRRSGIPPPSTRSSLTRPGRGRIAAHPHNHTSLYTHVRRFPFPHLHLSEPPSFDHSIEVDSSPLHHCDRHAIHHVEQHSASHLSRHSCALDHPRWLLFLRVLDRSRLVALLFDSSVAHPHDRPEARPVTLALPPSRPAHAHALRSTCLYLHILASMTSTWQPSQDGLAELVQLFRDSQSPQMDVQERIAQRLDAVSQIPDYANYCVFTLTSLTTEDSQRAPSPASSSRTTSSSTTTSISPESFEYVKQAIIPALSLPEDMLRRTATQVVSMLMTILTPQGWPEGLSKLGELMGSQNTDEAEGAFSSLAKICEDIPRELELCEINGVKPIDILIPNFINATPSTPTRACACMRSTASTSSAWCTTSSTCSCSGGDEDDAAVPDRAEDIKPRHYGGGGAHRNEHLDDAAAANGGAAATGKSRAAIEAQDDEEDDFDEDDEDDEDDDGISDWNLRKCSAAALDVMAVNFGDELLEILLPYLKERLFSDDWLQRECGILALGAIEGCIAGIQPHLPTLVPFLINSLKDSKPLVRSITCWTLGRYSSWCVAAETPEHQQQFFVPAMEGLLSMVLDNNKRVQEAGCSAFATLEEEAGRNLEPFLEPVLKTLVYAFDKYQQKNLLILYDALGTLADSVGSALNRPEYVEIVMPPLIAKWQGLHDTDPDLIPLLECMSSVTIAVGPGFLPYSPPVFQRCVGIVHDNLAAAEAEAQKPAVEQDVPDRTFIIVALDLLSGLTQGLNTAVRDLVAGIAAVAAAAAGPLHHQRRGAGAPVGVCAAGRSGHLVLRPAQAVSARADARAHPTDRARAQDGECVGVQQCGVGGGRDCAPVRVGCRADAVGGRADQAAGARAALDQVGQVALGECGGDDRPAGTGAAAAGGAASGRLHRVVVPGAVGHQGQRRKGLGLPWTVRDDPGEPQRRRQGIRLLLQRRRTMVHAERRAQRHVPQDPHRLPRHERAAVGRAEGAVPARHRPEARRPVWAVSRVPKLTHTIPSSFSPPTQCKHNQTLMTSVASHVSLDVQGRRGERGSVAKHSRGPQLASVHAHSLARSRIGRPEKTPKLRCSLERSTATRPFLRLPQSEGGTRGSVLHRLFLGAEDEDAA